MAIPAFANTVPLIASSFDALNSQRFAWTNRNDQVEAQNIARANAAQEQQNRYRFDVSRMQQEAAIRDAAAREAAQRESLNLLLGARADRENTRRFDIQTGLTRDQIKVQERRYQFAADKERKELADADKTVENYAEEFRKPLFSIGKKRDASESEYMQAQQEFEQQAQRLESLPSDQDLLKLTPGSPEKEKITKEVAEAKAAFSKAQGRLAIAKETFALAERDFSGLAKEAQDFGLSVKRDGDKYAFFRPRDARTFSMYPDELVPQARIGPAVVAPAAAPVAAPAFVPQTMTATNQQRQSRVIKNFTSEADARANGRVDGDVVIVNGRKALLVPD
jgi:hypothetical protein